MRHFTRILTLLVALTSVGGLGSSMGQLIANSQSTLCAENPIACR